MSEVDPTYGLQNGFNFGFDAAGAFTPQLYGGLRITAANTQVDNARRTCG